MPNSKENLRSFQTSNKIKNKLFSQENIQNLFITKLFADKNNINLHKQR